MKFRDIFFLALFFPPFYGCANNSFDNIPKNKTDLEKENLKGDVVFVMGISDCYVYNDKGMISRQITGVKNEYFNNTKYTYLNDKLSIEENSSFFGGESENKITSYVYDLSGKLISSHNVDSKCNYVYNLNGQLLKEKCIGKNYSTHEIYYYNNEKMLDSTIQFFDFYDSKSLCKEIYHNNKIDSFYFFDLANSPDRKLTDLYINKYNENGDLIQFIRYEYNSDQPIIVDTKYEYGYDANKNWTQQTSFVNGNEDKVENRTIIYKGGDYTSYLKKFDELIASFNRNNNSNTFNNNQSNTYQQPAQRVKQWVNCKDCNGQGIRICTDCTGRGSKKCDYCFGRGWKWYGTEKQTCNTCGGTGEKKCNSCYGKGNRGTCSMCGGRGQVQF